LADGVLVVLDFDRPLLKRFTDNGND